MSGRWHAPCCGQRWHGRNEGTARVFALEGEKGWQMTLINDPPEELEDEITYLKGCTLLTEIGGRKIEKE
eukprot:6648173-Lingulodinium_polyedra.AAC.1